MQKATHFNLLEVYSTIVYHKKKLAAWVISIVAITTAVVFIMPKYYLSTCVLVAGNPQLADKARLFNNNIQNLYSNFGTQDDLDRIEGVANLDTTYKQLVKEFNLFKYYKLKETSYALNMRKAVLSLKDDIKVGRNELGEYTVDVLTKDKQLSANIANRMVEIVKLHIEKIWQQSYQTSIEKITSSISSLEQEVSSIDSNANKTNLSANKQQALLQQLQQHYTALNEFKLALSNSPNTLYVIEAATPAAKHHYPKKLYVLSLALALSFLFGCVLIAFFFKKP